MHSIDPSRLGCPRMLRARSLSAAILALLLLALCAAGGVTARAADDASTKAESSSESSAQTAAKLEFFENRVRPLLAKHCYECHSAKSETLQASLRLDARSHLLKGGDTGPAVEPGNPDESLLIQSVRWEAYEMPPRGKLKNAEVEVLVRWIEDGAVWPRDQAQATESKSPNGPVYDYAKWRREHWAFRPLDQPTPPKVGDTAWPQNEIDRFLLAQLEANGLRPSPPAEPYELARRIYFDLIGLPPTPEQVDAFHAAYKQDPDAAVASLVDRLLASDLYGERWGRYWLDVARYSDGLGGFLDNAALPHAWRYRDWVIEAFNRDLPFDRFIELQVAGDLISDDPRDRIATGFFALGPTYRSDGGDPESVAQAKAETLSDRLDTLGRGVLGLTLACARCHAHKFDPIPQEDYYALAGVFNNTRVHEAAIAPDEVVKSWNDQQASIQQLDKQIKDLEKQLKKEKRPANDMEQQRLDAWRADLKQRQESLPPKYPTTHALTDSGSQDMKLAIRGDLRKPGPVTPRGFLRVFAKAEPQRFRDGSGRRELAATLVAPENPLTPRVFVNRIWRHHFGKALARTPSNFGVIGEPPTHPQLLDWLAAQFVADGWSVKQLHRRIMNSSAYRMSSRRRDEAFTKDGDNRLLWRFNPRRLDVEAWRDGLLSVCGELQLEPRGGPPTDNVNAKRRTLYFKVSRNGDRFASDEFLRLFDFPLMRATIAKRPSSIVPQQYLFMLNSDFMQQRALAFSTRLQQASPSDRERIKLAYRLLYGRAPTARELAIGESFLRGSENPPPEDVSSRQAAESQADADLLIDDFEGDSYGDWSVTGDAFGPGPAQGTLPGQMIVSGHLGQGLVNSYFRGDGTTGTLTSPPMKIERPYIHFLIGGGKFPGQTCINLLIDGKMVRTATGPNDRGGGTEKLAWARWDVSEFRGRDAVIQIVDQRQGGWGHINVDHIYQSVQETPDPTLAPSAPRRQAPSRWQQYAQVLLSSNEFMYLP